MCSNMIEMVSLEKLYVAQTRGFIHIIYTYHIYIDCIICMCFCN